MSVVTTGSPDIALLDSKIVADLCAGTFCVDVTPSVYIGSGADTVLGANVEIRNPFNVIIKPYGANYEIAPALSGGMDAAICFNIPTQAGNYQYGKYTVNVELFDSEGNSWVVTKTVSICSLVDKTKKYGSLSAQMKVNCADGKLFVIIDTVPTYNGRLVESQVLTGTLDYPTASGLTPLSLNTGNFAVTLFEGVYKLTGEICATYNYSDNVFAKVKYKIKKEHDARCLLDECCVYAKLSELQLRTETDCTDAEKEATASTIVEALSLFELAKLSGNCGEDPSDWIDKLEALLGCKCTCNCNEGAPIINNTPSGDVIVQGCNVSVVTNGLTKTYTIENYEYVVAIAANGGALIVAPATLDGCTKTQQITFDISVVYSQIKTLAGAYDSEGDIWAAIVNKSLRNIDPTCLGVTSLAWAAMTFAQRFAAVISKICTCCGTCDSTITNVVVTQEGNNVRLSWQGVAYQYEVYLDGTLVTTILTSAADALVYTSLLSGAADGETHTWLIVSKCSNGNIGETETDTFAFIGCPTYAAPVLASDSTSAACPYDLTSISYSVPAGTTIEWHSANDHTAASLVANPTSVTAGAYYAFAKDADGCYSAGVRFDLTCTTTGSCTAPQNLEVVVFGIYNFFVKFQSAAYPPPSNSYTVKRRLASAPDVGGSYTTIGTPVWNASLNRWVIADVTASDNIEYVYKAISNCGATEPSVTFPYINTICPSVTLYPTDTTVSYSVTPPAFTGIFTVQIYDSTGTVQIDADTYTNPAGSLLTGLFEYLSSGTTYKVRVGFKYTVTGIIKYCPFQTVTTDEAP